MRFAKKSILNSLLLKRPTNTKDLEEWEWEVLKIRLRFNVRLLESTGLDLVFSGEAWRREMYEHAAKDIDGIYLEEEHIRSFDDRFYKPGVRVKGVNVQRKKTIYLEELEYTQKIARKPLGIAIQTWLKNKNCFILGGRE